MSSAAILGAGPIGSAIAHALARAGEFREIRLVDAATNQAAGKALDIQQSGPVDHFETRLEATADPLAAAGASVIVLADTIADGEWQGEPALALLRTLARAGANAPVVLAGAAQIWVMEAAVRELGLGADRLVGTAASAIVGAARALVGLEINGSGVDVQVTVAGRPPALVAVWSSATIAGSLVADRVPAHRLRAISTSLRSLWPPGPQAIAAATARVCAGLVAGSRQRQQAVAVIDGEFGTRGVAAMLPLDLGRGRILERFMPSLSPQERTEVVNGLRPS